jgi:hypothetical protein
MGDRRVEGVAESKASRAQVWAVLDDVERWHEWGPWNKTRFEREGEPRPGGVGAVRELKMPGSTIREEIVVHDAPSRLEYTLLSGLPVRNYRAVVQLTELDGGGTRIDWSSEFDGKFPGAGPLMSLVLGRAIGDAPKRVARAAERRQTS